MDRVRRHLDKLLLSAIFILLTAATIRWTLADQTPPAWDPADHISAGYDYYAPLARFDLGEFGREFFIYPHYYAPFTHLVSAMIFFCFGASRVTGIGVNFVALAVLLAAVYGMNRALYAKRPPTDGLSVGVVNATPSLIAGVLAALLASCYHFSAWLLHDAFLDFPLMAITAASFALLIRADDFQNRRAAIWFGVVAGCGMLTKQTFAFFFVLPALFVTLRVLWSRNLRAVANLALAGAIIVLVSAIWYAPHFEEVMQIYRVNQAAAVKENEAPLWSLMSNAFYLHGLVSPQIQLPFGVLFVAGLAYSIIRRRKESILLWLWLASGLIGFTMVANKDLRYTVPILPAVALLSVGWLNDLKFDWQNKLSMALKLAPVAAIAVWALVSFFNAQYPAEGMGNYIDSPRFRWMVFARNYFGFDHRPRLEDWSVPQIVRTVERDWQEQGAASVADREGQPPPLPTASETVSPMTHKAKTGKAPVLGVVVNLAFLNPSNVALYARLLTRERGSPALIDVVWLTSQASQSRTEECDYLLVRTGLDQAEWVEVLERDIEALLQRQPQQFQRLAAFPLPIEGAQAVLYRRIR